MQKVSYRQLTIAFLLGVEMQKHGDVDDLTVDQIKSMFKSIRPALDSKVFVDADFKEVVQDAVAYVQGG